MEKRRTKTETKNTRKETLNLAFNKKLIEEFEGSIKQSILKLLPEWNYAKFGKKPTLEEIYTLDKDVVLEQIHDIVYTAFIAMFSRDMLNRYLKKNREMLLNLSNKYTTEEAKNRMYILSKIKLLYSRIQRERKKEKKEK